MPNVHARPEDIKLFFMLNSTEHEISITYKGCNFKTFFAIKHVDKVFILLINVKMPTIVDIFDIY